MLSVCGVWGSAPRQHFRRERSTAVLAMTSAGAKMLCLLKLCRCIYAVLDQVGGQLPRHTRNTKKGNAAASETTANSN